MGAPRLNEDVVRSTTTCWKSSTSNPMKEEACSSGEMLIIITEKEVMEKNPMDHEE
jgi:hypothetical protein